MTIFRGRCKGNNIVVLNTAARLATVRGCELLTCDLRCTRTSERRREKRNAARRCRTKRPVEGTRGWWQMVVGRRRVPRLTLRETWRSPSMRDNYGSPAFFPVPHVSLRNFPQFFNQSSWFEEESSKDRPRFLLLPASAISEKAILGYGSHCTGATCDISTSNYFSRTMAHDKYALFAHANISTHAVCNIYTMC